MPSTGLTAFDKTIEKTNVWLKEIMELQGWSDRNKAYTALRVVLHSLRDRLTPEEAAHFAAELPLMVRGIYYEGWSPEDKPVKMDREIFLLRVAKAFPDDPEVDPKEIARTVFQVLEKRISEGEISDIKNLLPHDLRELWPRSGEP